MKTLNVTEAKAKFSAIVEQAQAGDETIVMKMGKPVAKVVPYRASEQGGRLGIFKGLVVIADDFDEWSEEEREALAMDD